MASKLIFLALLVICALCVEEISAGKKLIVVLVDGFKWDYIDDPNLHLKGIPKIIKNGVRAPYVNPVYPALSYPNWYSIVTGLYPESHGIVNNIMYDSKTGASFLMLPHEGSTDVHWWNGAEPIWVTAEKQGKNAAMYWWAGCEVRIRGVEPMICERHRYGPGTQEEKNDYYERIDDIVEMFKTSQTDRLSLALIYYGPLDYTGHYSGPGTSETRRALQDIDEILYEMLLKIKDAGLQNEVNIMIVSDHGMTDTRQTTVKYIDLEKFAPSIKFQVSYGATMMLVPEDGMLDKLYSDLKNANINGVQVYKKEEIPESYHLKESPMMNDIFLKADKGYFLKSLNESGKVIGEIPKPYKGHHGFHPDDVPDMRTIFFATGPGFRRGVVSKPLTNTDLYNMMCSILDITPLPNNGSMELVEDILSDETASPFISNSISAHHSNCIYISLCVIFVIALFISKYH